MNFRFCHLRLVVFLLLAFGLGGANGCRAQAVRHFERLTTQQGLSNNTINCIRQDREGFLWFGTEDGLNRYDAYGFTTYQPDPTDPAHSLAHSDVTDLLESRSGQFWVITNGGGLQRLDRSTGRFTSYQTGPGQPARCNGLIEEAGGLLWVASDEGISRFDPKTERGAFFPAPRPGDAVNALAEAAPGVLWVGTDVGLYRFDASTKTYARFPLESDQPDKNHLITALFQDGAGTLWVGVHDVGLYQIEPGQSRPARCFRFNQGGLSGQAIHANAIAARSPDRLWIGTVGDGESGLYELDKKTGRVTDVAPNGGLSNRAVWAVYPDRAGTLWVGTYGGVNKRVTQPKKFNPIQVTPDERLSRLPENNIKVLCEDHTGVLWVGSYTKGLHRYDRSQGTLRPYPLRPAEAPGTRLPSPDVLVEDRLGRFWLTGPDQQLYQLDPANGRLQRAPVAMPVSALCEDATGKLWFTGYRQLGWLDPQTGQSGTVAYPPDTLTGLPDTHVYALKPGRMGGLWLGTFQRGVLRFEPKTGRFVPYRAGTGQLNDDNVRSLYEDPAGILWVGTNQGGLNRLDPTTRTFTAFTTRHGLPSNHVEALLPDRAGNLWLATNHGLCRFDPRTHACRRYDESDGLQYAGFNRASAQSRRGELIFSGPNGFHLIHPETLRDNQRIPPVALTGFRVQDQPRSLPSGEATLSYRENSVSFEFVALNYLRPEKNQYAYQLVGVDSAWVYSGTRRFVSYTNLAPGAYEFRVKGSNNDGIWNERGATFRFRIRPPWWATWWAYGLYALIAGGSAWAFVRYRIRQAVQRQEMALKRREAEQLRALDEAKTRFFSNITHEFRTPLSLILTPVERLLSHPTDPATLHRTLTTVQRNAQHLLRLINQLLDLARLEAGGMKVVLVRGDLAQFVGECVETFRETAEGKGLALAFTPEGTLNPVLFDAGKVEKIVVNLLANAVKFTPTGRVSVGLVGSADAVRLTVADTGIGIPGAQLPQIFNRFFQVDDSPTRTHEGTGIGLALVRELVELLGGTITVASQPERGTTFTVTWPLPSPEVNAPSGPAEKQTVGVVEPGPPTELPVHSTETNAPEKPLVLVAEDNADLRAFLAESLAPDFRVVAAPDGLTAWQLALDELPEVVVSDLMMPGLDGYELTRRLRHDARTAHIPVVLLTARAAHESRMEGLRHGADEYLSKPFHADELHLRLRNLLTRQARLRQHYQTQLTRPDAPFQPETVEDEFLKTLYAQLERHLDDSAFGVQELATQLAMSRRTLHRKLATLTGLPANELMRQYRLKRAAQLLRTGYTPAETAYLVGYDSPAHFSTIFKEFYRQTPTEFAGR